MIAGGGILFCIAIMDLLVPTDKKRRMPSEDLGVVPLGTPLIVGPAVLTTSLLLIDQYGLYPTLVAVLLNIIIAGVVFSCSGRIIRAIGKSGSRALSKVMALLLAAIAVKMVRMGVFAILP
jgi:multiple antibiotic resistance protein